MLPRTAAIRRARPTIRPSERRRALNSYPHNSLYPLESDDFFLESSPRSRLLFKWRMIFSENRCPLFGIMLSAFDRKGLRHADSFDLPFEHHTRMVDDSL